MKTFLTLLLILILNLAFCPTIKFKAKSWPTDSDWRPIDTYNYLIAVGCKYALECTAQTVGEAGWNYTSEIAIHSNNIIGMKLATVRKTTATGKFKNHAVYRSKMECLDDLVLWQRATNVSGDYIEHLHKNGYFIQAEHKETLKKIIKKLKL